MASLLTSHNSGHFGDPHNLSHFSHSSNSGHSGHTISFRSFRPLQSSRLSGHPGYLVIRSFRPSGNSGHPDIPVIRSFRSSGHSSHSCHLVILVYRSFLSSGHLVIPVISSSSSSSSSRNVRGRGGLDSGRRDNAGYSYSPGSHPNQRGGWIPNFTRGGHRGGGGRGRNFY
jgi:hypothetical protein